MEKTRRLRTWGGFLLLLLLLLIFLIWNILAGSVRLPASEIWTIMQGGGELSQRRILLRIRLPRLLAALILGGALSVSGYLLQTFFHNPIAGPFVLGISSGAKLTVSITMVALLSRGLVSTSAVLIAAAFAGAMLSMGFERKKASTSAAPQTSTMVRTFSQLMPENEPSDQLCRFTMLESSAKVTIKSVSAVQI